MNTKNDRTHQHHAFKRMLFILGLSLATTNAHAAPEPWQWEGLTTAGSLNWLDGSNWNPSSSPNGAGAHVIINTAPTRRQTILLGSATHTLSRLDIGTATDIGSFYLSTGTLNFKSFEGGPAQINQLHASSRNQIHTVSTLSADLDISNASSNALFFTGMISSENNGLKTITISSGDVIFESASNSSGGIRDGAGQVKVELNGPGTVTMRGSFNNYTGGTFVNGGTLIVGDSVKTGKLSSAITINSGTLAGAAQNTASNVDITIGSGTGEHDAHFAPGLDDVDGGIGTFTTAGSLSFLSDATFKFQLNSETGMADRLAAQGVSLASGSLFEFTDIGAGTLAIGTTFTIIENLAATATIGSFANLAEGTTFTDGHNTFLASYLGGNGNDLTLTVVAIPEPSGALLLGLALIGGTFVHRKTARIASRP